MLITKSVYGVIAKFKFSFGLDVLDKYNVYLTNKKNIISCRKLYCEKGFEWRHA